ncbi:MAG: trimeric intracellular cation channel family protein [Acidobacteriota bacterium]
MAAQLLVSTATLLFTLDLIGTFVFALSGAVTGVKNKLDAFGIGVLAFVAGNAGGVTRDLLIGAVPPAAINDWRYVAVSLVAGAVTFVWYPNVKRLQPIVLLFDAAGLGLFAVAGTEKALAFGINPFVSALLGMLTGIGGGVLRDLLVNEIPVVLRADLYALAALAGAAVVVAGHITNWPPIGSTIAGAVLCFVLRLIAIRRGWSLPPARLPLSS